MVQVSISLTRQVWKVSGRGIGTQLPAALIIAPWAQGRGPGMGGAIVVVTAYIGFIKRL